MKQLHDRYVRKSLRIPQISQPFLEEHLPPELLEKVDVGRAEVTDDSFIDKNFKELISDVVIKLPRTDKQEDAYVYTVIEHKFGDKVKNLPIIMTRYLMSALIQLQGDLDKAPLIIPIVVYHDHPNKRYKGPMTVEACIDSPIESIYLPKNPAFHLIDVSTVSDEDLDMNVWTYVFYMALEHIRNPRVIEILKKLLPYMHQIAKTQTGLQFLTNTVLYIVRAGDVENVDEILDFTVESMSNLGEEVMTGFEKYLQKKYQERDRQAIQRMLDNGFNQKQMMIALDLTETEINLLTNPKAQPPSPRSR